MVHLCESQGEEWRKIADQLSAKLHSKSENAKIDEKGTDRNEKENHATIERPMTDPVQPVNPPREQMPHPEDPARARLRMRLAHVIRGVILIFALGLPRMFYYLYGVYGVFVLSGALEKLQSVEFRRYLTGSRPSLELQLSRLRQRLEMLEKLEEIERLMERDEPFDADDLRRVNEFLATFTPRDETSWLFRFNYQLFFMFFYSMLPACHPEPELIK